MSADWEGRRKENRETWKMRRKEGEAGERPVVFSGRSGSEAVTYDLSGNNNCLRRGGGDLLLPLQMTLS